MCVQSFSRRGDVLKSIGAAGIMDANTSAGSEIWASWIRKGIPHPELGDVVHNLVRAGVPPKHLPAYIKSQASTLRSSEYIVDFASGLLHIQNISDLNGLRAASLKMGGYAILLADYTSTEPRDDPWGYTPESIDLMKALKKSWDPYGILNPGAFVV